MTGTSPGRSDPATRAAEYVRRAEADLLAVIEAAATAVADDREGSMRDGRALAGALEAELDARGVTDRLPAVLSGAVDAAGLALAAQPVAAPPYVAVTSRGPVLRGSTPEGRLVVTLAVFDVDAGSEPRYERCASLCVESEFVAKTA